MVQIANPTGFLSGATATRRPTMSPLQALATGQQMGIQRRTEGREAELQPGRLAVQAQQQALFPGQLAAQEREAEAFEMERGQAEQTSEEIHRRTTLARSFLSLHAGIASPKPEAAKKAYEQAAELAEGTSLAKPFQDLAVMAPGKKRDEFALQLQAVGKEAGLYGQPPKQAGAQRAYKTAEQIQQEIDISERGAKAREAELEWQKQKAQMDAAQLSPTVEKDLSTVQERFRGTARNIGKYESLKAKMDSAIEAGGGGGGVVRSFQEWGKKFAGLQDDQITPLRTELMGLRASSAVQNLPPGVASDKDIELALSGFPPQNAPMSFYKSWITGMEKLARIDYLYDVELSKHMSETKSRAGWVQKWNDTKAETILGADDIKIAYDPKAIASLKKTAKKIQTQEDFDNLAIGDFFINPADGKLLVKRTR